MSAGMGRETLYAIRDLRGLPHMEQCVLMHIALRGEYRQSPKDAAFEMEMSPEEWTRNVASLRAKGLLIVQEVPDRPTVGSQAAWLGSIDCSMVPA